MEPLHRSANADLEPEGLRISILTVERRQGYVHRTLASLLGSGRGIRAVGSIDLVIDAAESSGYLAEYRGRDGLCLRYLSEEAWARQCRRPLGQRLCYAYWRSLHVDLAGCWGLVVLEDDVVVRPGFVEKLALVVEELRGLKHFDGLGEGPLERYLLALYSSHDFERDPSFYRGRYFCSYGYPFFGFCGMFYEPGTVPWIRDVMWHQGVEKHHVPGDIVIQELQRRGGPRIYACCRDLVQHVGAVSTGLSVEAWRFRSPTFDKPWEPVERRDWGR